MLATRLPVLTLASLAFAGFLAQAQVGQDYESSVKALSSKTASERVAGLVNLARMGTRAQGATRTVVALVRDPSADVRKQALVTLDAINPDIAPHIRDLAKPPGPVKGDDTEDRMIAMRRLVAMGDKAGPAVPALMDYFKELKGIDRVIAIQNMTAIGKSDPSLGEFFAKIAVNDVDANARNAALTGLAQLKNNQGGKDAFNKAFTDVLTNGDALQRLRAIDSMVNMGKGSPDAIKMLETAAKTDDSPKVQEAAKKALDKLQPKKK